MNKIPVDVLCNFKNGSKVAFKDIYTCYASSIFDVATKILRNESLAEEIVQESFLKLWLNRANINPHLDVWPYLFVICKRLCFNSIRNSSVAKEALKTIQSEEINDVEEKINYNELQHQLQFYVDALPHQQKTAWILSRVEGFSHQQIALEMGISQNTVKNHIGQAIKFLRKRLSNSNCIYLLLIYLFF